jgi:hypothetical protein
MRIPGADRGSTGRRKRLEEEAGTAEKEVGKG